MQILIIGCGNMGKGLAHRLSGKNELYLYDRGIEKARHLEQAGYGKACEDIKDGLEKAKIIILAVKPQNLNEVSSLFTNRIKKGHILVSLLTGTSIATLSQFFPGTIVRMMPNLALIYGEGVIGLSSDHTLSEANRTQLNHIFQPLGKIHWLPEDKINALTALTGSGPAFVFVMVESMVDAAISMGFSLADAKALVHQMLIGSLSLLENTSKHPGELKWQITSPQGTTIAGLKILEESALRGAIINTFLAAYDRAIEIQDRCKG